MPGFLGVPRDVVGVSASVRFFLDFLAWCPTLEGLLEPSLLGVLGSTDSRIRLLRVSLGGSIADDVALVD